MPNFFTNSNPNNPFGISVSSGNPSLGQTPTGLQIPNWNPMVFNIPTWNPNNSGVKINSNVDGVGVSTNQTTLDKTLNWITQLFAIQKGAAYIPTTQQPQQQPSVIYQQYPNQNLGQFQDNSTGGNIESFIKNNTGLLLLVGLGAVLLFKDSPSKR